MSKLALKNRHSGANLSAEEVIIVMVRAHNNADEISQGMLQLLSDLSPCIDEKDELDEKTLFDIIAESLTIDNYEVFKEVQDAFNTYKKILADFRVINKGDV